MEPKFNEKNVVVVYKGGGYEGCIFEYNYFLVDSEGKFHDIFSSGRMGITDELDAIAMLNSYLALDDPTDDDSIDIVIHLDKEEEIDKWQKEANASRVSQIVTKVNSILLPNTPMFWKCEECGKKVFISGSENEQGIQYCGGLAYSAKNLICDDCLSIGACSDCGTFVGKDNLNEDDLCECCEEMRAEEKSTPPANNGHC